MALGTSFTLSGSTPTNSRSSSIYGALAKPTSPLISPTPQVKALNSAVKPPVKPAPTPQAQPQPSSSTGPAMKSQKVTETTYHSPQVGTNSGFVNPKVQGANDQIASNGGVSSQQVGNPSIPNKVETPVEQPKAPEKVSYPGLVGKGQESLARAEDIALEGAKLRTAMQTSTQNEMGNNNHSGPVRIGAAGLIQQNLGTQLQGLAASESAARGVGQSFLDAAGKVAPVQLPYSNQFIDPTTGQPIGGGVNGSLQSAVTNVAEKIKTGKMTYNDGVAALAGYGQGGINALQESLPPGFNIAQSNTLGGQQGSIGVNYQLAETALANVENILKDLSPAQTTNIPLINKGANWISTQFGVGSEQTRAMTGAVQSLRNAYASLLSSVKGGTPTDYSSQAVAEIPNEPTPNDIAAIRQNFETLGKARLDILGNPGQAGNQSQSGNIFAEQW